MLIDFFQTSITVFEGEVASIEIGRVDGSFERPVQVTVSTMDGSATANEDYVPFTTSLTFDDTSNTQVVTVTIINNIIVEATEIFTVVLSSVDPDVNLDETPLTILIRDAGKVIVYMYSGIVSSSAGTHRIKDTSL